MSSGAPLLIAQWGAGADKPTIVNVDEKNPVGRRRMFSLRTFERNRELLSSAADIESDEMWSIGDDSWAYHVFWLRVR